jgi:hypothetical protein
MGLEHAKEYIEKEINKESDWYGKFRQL